MLTDYSELIDWHYDTLNKEDARLSDLPDAAKDRAVYLWLKSHKSWYDDIYPASISRSVGDIATEMLFGKAPVASRIVTNLFVAMAEDSDLVDRDDLWWTCAGDIHLDTIVNLGNFADEFRSLIYLYLEGDIEDAVFEQKAKYDGEMRREAGIYLSEVQGNC